ncbi:hypothetical protein [Salisediminibacterium beveridgei]|uniref:hypothetical protein n=1 Tax=Salisediminibacterium beveridgei TaxID=632773 RepID=UPI0018DE3F71|nr:hypothetical protein [Salisediminibacterium beveridgei]
MLNDFVKKINQLGVDLSGGHGDVIDILIHFTPFKVYVYVADYNCFESDVHGVEFSDPEEEVDYHISGNYVCVCVDDEALTQKEKIQKVLKQYALSEEDVVIIDLFEKS